MPSTPSESPNPNPNLSPSPITTTNTPPQPTTNPSPSSPNSNTPKTLYQIFTLTHPPTYLPNGTMTELSFAKTYLSTLDSRPLKLQPDYSANPKTLSVNGPYTLPKMPTAFKRPDTSSSALASSGLASSATAGGHGQGQGKKAVAVINVTLKSSKNPVLNLSLPATETGTTILDLKGEVSGALKLGGTDKIRVLYNKKPVGDVKTLKELLDSSSSAGNDNDNDKGEVELGVMVMGYSKDVTMTDAHADADAGGRGPQKEEKDEKEGGKEEEVLGKEEFWADLRAFLMQRIGDEGKAGEVFGRFRESWEKR